MSVNAPIHPEQTILALPIPVTLLTGFLGAGKTTLLNGLLAGPALRRTAVIVNELGAIGIDHDLVRVAEEQTVRLMTGCLCCTVRGDLVRTLHLLRRERALQQVPPFERVVIETTGIAEPGPVLQTLASDPVLEATYVLSAVVTVVDAVNGQKTLLRQPEAPLQVALADRLVVSKTDLVPETATASLHAQLRRINGSAPIMTSHAAVADPDLVLAPVDGSAERVLGWLGQVAHNAHQQHRHHGHDLGSFCLRDPKAVRAEVLADFLDVLTGDRGDDLLRVKGLVKLAEQPERPLAVHVVQHLVHEPFALDAWPSADRDTRMVFITRGIPGDAVRRFWQALTGPGRS